LEGLGKIVFERISKTKEVRGDAAMSLRMRKQTLRKTIGQEKLWVPGPGNYKHETKADVGGETRNLQQWKAPMRKTNWYHRPTDSV